MRKQMLYTRRELGMMLAPLVIEQVLVMLVGMVDTVMVSGAGEAAVSGVALVDMVNYLIITVMAALTTGGAVVISQYLGSGQEGQAAFSAGQLVQISGLLSMGIAGLCLLFRHGIMRLFFGAVEPAVMDAALTYFVITACSFPFLGLYEAGAALYRVLGRTSVTMYISLGMNLINLVGDYVGVQVLHAGVAGVAVPTLLSRIFAAAVMLALAFQPDKTIRLEWRHIFCRDRAMVSRILYIAVPGGVENGLFAMGKVLVVSIVSHFGTVQIAANGVANSVSQIAVMVVNAVNLAIVPVVGQCMGSGDPDQAYDYTRKLMRVSYVSLFVLGLGVCLLLPVILPFYRLEAETLGLAARLVVLHNLLALAFHPTSFNLPNSLRAAGDVRYTMMVGIGSMMIFRLGGALLLGNVLGWGVTGVWIAMGLDWLARSIAFCIRYHSQKWRQMQVIERSAS